MTVLFLPEIREYFKELSLFLFEKDYFGFFEDALRYADDLFAEIEKDLPIKSSKPAPKYFDKYGKDMRYTSFKRNRNMTWYAFLFLQKTNGKYSGFDIIPRFPDVFWNLSGNLKLFP